MMSGARAVVRTMLSGLLCALPAGLPVAIGCADTEEAGPSAGIDAEAFVLTSPEVPEGGTLPVDCTCDGSASTLELRWDNPPTSTQSFSVIMHHVASPADVHWYWVLYDIPASVQELKKNCSGIGRLGTNSVNGRTEYAPPCSQGPGPKVYTYTVYACSGRPAFAVPDSSVTRAVLLEAMRGIVLDSAVLNVVYSR